MPKYLKIILPVLLFFVFIRPALAQDKINLYFFNGNGCPHCAKEEKFLNKLEQENSNIKVYNYEVWYNQDNAKILSELGQKLSLNVSGVPLLIIGDKSISGYFSDETTGEEIKKIINYYTVNECNDVVASILAEKGQTDSNCQVNSGNGNKTPEKVSVPFFGEINIKGLSLPVFTIIIGALDGFNPCAMWVLLFLISLLLGMKDRKKMWIFGSSFIIASGAVYFLFLAAWLSFFLFIGFIFWIRLIIGVFAMGSGYYHLKQYFKNRKGVCAVTGDEKRRAWFDRLKVVIAKENFWLALGGIIILAAAVNLVELLCSAGLPAIYTQVLSLSNLPTWEYYAYLVLYIFIFMLDDILVFVIAMLTLQMKAVNSKYASWSNLIGGIIIFLIGFLLIFKPGWLMFG